MINSKTTLMELTKKYRSILKKCFLLNMGLVLFASSTNAGTVTINDYYPVLDTDYAYNQNLVIEDPAEVVMKNGTLSTGWGTPGDSYTFNIHGGTFTMDNSEIVGRSSLYIDGGSFDVKHGSEVVGTDDTVSPNLNIENAVMNVNSSVLAARTDGSIKGDIYIEGSSIVFNTGFIGAFNWSDSNTEISEGGHIGMIDSTLSFKGGNGITDSRVWKNNAKDAAGGSFVANEILAENIDLYDSQFIVEKKANVKTTAADYTANDNMDLSQSASTINLDGASQLKVYGALRANVVGNTDSTITLGGLLKGTVSTDGLLVLNNGAKIDGALTKTSTLNIDGMSGDLNKILRTALNTVTPNITDLTLSGAKSKYTWNTSTFTENHVGKLVVDGKATLSNKSAFGANSITLDNGAVFNANAKFTTNSTLLVNHGSRLALNKFNFDGEIPRINVQNGSTFVLSNAGTSKLLSLTFADSNWTGQNTWLDLGSLGITQYNNTGDSKTNLTGMKVFAEQWTIYNPTPSGKLSVTLNNGTILSGHSPNGSNPLILGATIVLNNSTLGNQPIAIVTDQKTNSSINKYNKDAANETLEIANSTITLNGNSSIKNSLLHQIISKKNQTTFKDLSVGYWDQNQASITATGGSDSGLNAFSNNLTFSNSTVTMKGTSSLINNSWNTGGGNGHIVFTDNSVVNVLGKNTFTAAQSVRVESGATLNIAKGASLKVLSGDDYSDNTIYTNTGSANLVIAGTLDGNWNGYAKNITLAPTTKITGTVNFTGCIYGFGLSGVNNVKDGNKVFAMFDQYAETAPNVALNTLILDNSKLSLSMLDQIHNTKDAEDPKYHTAYDIPGDLVVQNKSTLTVNNMDDELPDWSPTNVSVKDSTINVQKNGSMEISNLDMDNSTLTATGDVKNEFDPWSGKVSGTGMSVGVLTATNSTLNLTNAVLDVAGNIDLTNTAVKVTGNVKNTLRTAILSGGKIDIDNNNKPKATVTLTGANLVTGGGNVTIKGTSFTFNGDATRYKNGNANYITAGYFTIQNYIHNPKLSVTLANGNIYTNSLSISDVDNVKLANMNIYDTSMGNTDNTNIWAKNVNVSNTTGNIVSMNVTNSATVNNSTINQLSVRDAQKATVSKSVFTNLNVSNIKQATISNNEINSLSTYGAMSWGPKQKVVYDTNVTVTNTAFGNGEIVVRDAYLTISKGNTTNGITLNINGDQGDFGAQSAYALVKENFTTEMVDYQGHGTIEVAPKKTLTVNNLIDLRNDDGVLLIKGKVAAGSVNFQNSEGTIVIANNGARLSGDTINFGTNGTLEFRDVKGSFNTFVSADDLALNNVKLTNSTLTFNNDQDMGTFTMAKSNLYLGTNKLKALTANIHNNSNIYINIDANGNYGAIQAKTINLETMMSKGVEKPTNINLIVTLPKSKTNNPAIYGHTYKFFGDLDEVAGDYTVTGNLNKVTVANNRYRFEEVAVGQFSVTATSNGRGVIERYAGGVNPGVLSAAAAFVDSDSIFTIAKQAALADGLNTLSQVVGGEEDYIQALDAVNPDDSGIVQTTSLAATNTLLDVAAARMSMGGVVAGMSAGDVVGNHGAMWGQGLYNQTKLDSTSKYLGFKGISKGAAFGVEGNLSDDVKVGLAYAYTQNDIKAKYRKMEVDTHGVSLYGEYKPNNWFANAIAGFAWSDYDAKAWSALGTTRSDFDVYTYSAQLGTGYEFDLTDKVQMVPSVGLRYVNLNQRSYKDSDGKRIGSTHNDVVTALIGNKFSASYVTNDGVKLSPELRIGMSYDIHSDATESVVGLSNGTSYQVPSRRLKRFGVTGGIGGVITAGDWDLTLGYDLDIRKEYRSHTGSLKAKYHF